MRKKLCFVLAALFLLSLAACGDYNKGIKITLESDTAEDGGVALTADFYYPEDTDIEIEGDEFYPNWKILSSEKDNFELSLSLFEDTTFDANRDYAKEDETYKEFKIGEYDAYGYEAFGGYLIYIHLEEVSETTDRYIVIEANRADLSIEGPQGAEAYENNKIIKSIVNSLVYNGIQKAQPK